jgi:hypothetical protein
MEPSLIILKTAYAKLTPYQKVVDYFSETIFAVEIIRYASNYELLIHATPKEKQIEYLENLKKGLDSFYKNFNAETDKKLFAAMLKMYYEDVDKSMHPDFYKDLEKKYRGILKNMQPMCTGNLCLFQKKK